MNWRRRPTRLSKIETKLLRKARKKSKKRWTAATRLQCSGLSYSQNSCEFHLGCCSIKLLPAASCMACSNLRKHPLVLLLQLRRKLRIGKFCCLVLPFRGDILDKVFKVCVLAGSFPCFGTSGKVRPQLGRHPLAEAGGSTSGVRTSGASSPENASMAAVMASGVGSVQFRSAARFHLPKHLPQHTQPELQVTTRKVQADDEAPYLLL